MVEVAFLDVALLDVAFLDKLDGVVATFVGHGAHLGKVQLYRGRFSG